MATWYCASDKWTAVTPWAATTAYSVGDIRRQLATPTVGQERVWRCTTAGTSGGSEPAPWTLTKGSTTNDNTVVWTEITGDSTYNTNPSNMVAPHARIESAAAWMAAGDTLYIGDGHAQTSNASAVTVTFPGTTTSPNYIYIVDDTLSTPTLSSGATFTTTSTAAITIQGSFYMEASSQNGFIISAASGAVSQGMTIGSSSDPKQVYKNISLRTGGTTAGNIAIGSSVGSSGSFEFYNCTFKYGSTTGKLLIQGNVKIYGGSYVSGSATAANLIHTSGNSVGAEAIIEGFDFTNAGDTFDVFAGGSSDQIGTYIFKCCKFPSSWSGDLIDSDITVPGIRFEMHACSTADKMYVDQIEDYSGLLQVETATFVRSSGASVPSSESGGNDPQTFSWKITPRSLCSYPSQPFKTSDIAILDLIVGSATVGVPLTLTAHALVDSATAVTNADFWMEVSYPGTAGSTAYTVTDNKPTNALTTPTELSAGYGWTTTGMTNPQPVISTITFTPNEIGVILVRLCFGDSAFTTYYADPKIA